MGLRGCWMCNILLHTSTRSHAHEIPAHPLPPPTRPGPSGPTARLCMLSIPGHIRGPTSDATVEGPPARTPWTQPTKSRRREQLRVGFPRYDPKTDNTGTHIGRQTVGGELWLLGSLDLTQRGWMWGGGQGRVRDDDGCFSGGSYTLHLLLVIPRPCMGTLRCRQFGWRQSCGDILQTKEAKCNTCLLPHANCAREHISSWEKSRQVI